MSAGPTSPEPTLTDLEQLLMNYTRQHNSNEQATTFHISTTRIDQVDNWDAIFSDKTLMCSLLFYVLFMISEIVISYAAFLYSDVPNLPVIYAVSMFFNIISAYTFPFIAFTSMTDNINDPFTDLHREVRGCQAFILSIIVQIIALPLSIWSTISLFKYAPYTHINPVSENGERVSIDVTMTLKCFQLISLQLLLLGLVTTILNYWFIRDRLLNYLNRIERTFAPDGTVDTEIPEVYDQYLKTMRSKVNIPL